MTPMPWKNATLLRAAECFVRRQEFHSSVANLYVTNREIVYYHHVLAGWHTLDHLPQYPVPWVKVEHPTSARLTMIHEIIRLCEIPDMVFDIQQGQYLTLNGERVNRGRVFYLTGDMGAIALAAKFNHRRAELKVPV